ncbi:tetratricopeptide repeat protein [Cyanobacterium stanieri LEGE 03274]|uniref:Tetratricopeptide repeat protein n=1 Tax=Cyanobacterium stanieri LEGE 03274 TaxID=1828756 RepID=A0ABR9V4R1_9CHRO|nr:tetratricopeptide repeat protein [Cyanobacterium stanieri]MBE9222832.1 tetratricopeptide repeat protein [Cyanobacterium stanieri LEGE 03274]
MDKNFILQEQQKDFCHRLKIDALCSCQSENCYSEIDTIKSSHVQAIINHLKPLLRDKKNNPNYQQLLSKYFLHRLGEQFLQQRYQDLVSLEKATNHLQNLNHNFIIKGNNNFNILVQTTLKSDEIYWFLNQEDIDKYELIIFFISIYSLQDDIQDYPLILAGFLPQEYIKKYITKDYITISDLFYGGGLKGYLRWARNHQINKFTRLGTFHDKKGEFDLAIHAYNQALNIGEANAHLYFLRGVALWKQGHYRRAIDDFSAVIKLDSNHLLAYHWRGFAYTYFQEYESALEDYEQEVRINPVSFLGYYKRALIKTKLGNFLGALDDYRICITINPSFFLAYYNRAFVYLKLKDYEDAMDDYVEALKFNPNLYQAHYNLGYIHQMLGNHSECIASYKNSLRLKPDYEKSYFNLAILQADLGYIQKAIALYDKILSMNPNFIQAKYNRDALFFIRENEGKLLGEYTEYNNQKNQKIPYLVDIKTYNSLIKKKESSD